MFDDLESGRRQAAQDASDALDPFHFTVDIDCEEPEDESPEQSANSAETESETEPQTKPESELENESVHEDVNEPATPESESSS